MHILLQLKKSLYFQKLIFRINHAKGLKVISRDVSDRVDGGGSVGSHGPKSVMNVQEGPGGIGGQGCGGLENVFHVRVKGW